VVPGREETEGGDETRTVIFGSAAEARAIKRDDGAATDAAGINAKRRAKVEANAFVLA
jgi:hypothetical protein